jgi:signal transduction histidine kinase
LKLAKVTGSAGKNRQAEFATQRHRVGIEGIVPAPVLSGNSLYIGGGSLPITGDDCQVHFSDAAFQLIGYRAAGSRGMNPARYFEEWAKRQFSKVSLPAVCFLACVLAFAPAASSATIQPTKLVVVLYPEAYNGSPGNTLSDQGLRAVFGADKQVRIEIHNEYLEVSRFPEADYPQELTAYLRRKYAGRKVDLVIAGLSSAFDFAIRNRDLIFPNVPLVFLAVDEQEVKVRSLATDVVGAPIRMDLADSLDLALRLHPHTEQVFVIAGRSKFDAYWEGEARKAFGAHAQRIKFNYLSGLPLADLVEQVKDLPDHSIVYYLHVFEDGDGLVYMPAEVLDQISAAARVPIYSHVGTYVGRGTVGGRVFDFEAAGRRAAEIGLRILGGESPQAIGIQPAIENRYVFDGRQLKRWGIQESRLPAGSIVRYREPSVWEDYKWQITATIVFVILQAGLILLLSVQRFRLARAKHESHDTQRELRELAGRLLVAQETERRRIAGELHDDFGQSLALLSVETDLLHRQGSGPKDQFESRIEAMSAQIKQLSSSIHDLSHQLHPLKLEQLGLVAAVGGLCNELARAHGVQIDLHQEDMPRKLPQETAVCLYRIVQEALRNVIKHSDAGQAVVELRGVASGICLRIRDNGVGFNLNSANNQDGLGLVSMRERLRAVEGEIIVKSEPLRGTEIEVRVPHARAVVETREPLVMVVNTN